MKKHILSIFMAVILLFASASCSVDVNNNRVIETDELRIHFIDVGQADCILIELPTDEEILIDAGNRDDSQVIINYLEQLGIDDIEYFILTHPHEDHIGFAPAVLDYYDVERVYMPDVAQDSQIYRDTIFSIENGETELIKAKAGTSIINSEDISFYVLAPNSMWYSETNEYSLVTRLTYKDTSFLFTGDAESVSETEIINAGYDIDSDLLKVGHHGGRTSTSQSFLDCVSPEYAVISVGKDNPYGHPHDEVLKRLNNSGAQTFRTDEMGSITAVSDGNNIKIDKSQISESNNITNAKYVGNINSMKLHYPDCSSVKDMKDKNKRFFKSRDKAIKQGFTPCSICKP